MQASVVAIQPSTGKILAMASLPTFDPNKLASHDFAAVKTDYDRLQADPAEPLLNRAIQTTLPPGSTFKLVTASAAIESGKYTADSEVPGGPTYQLPQTTGSSGQIDNEGRDCGTDKIPFSQAMEQSCNTTFAQLGVELGADALQEQAEAFGFNEHYLDDIGPQAISIFPEDANEPAGRPDRHRPVRGRGPRPLQMAMVAAGIANQGVVMKPYIVDSIQSPELETLKQTEPEELDRAVSAGDRRRGHPADGRHRRRRHRRRRARSPASRWPARPAPRRAATPTCRRTPGSSRSPRPRTRRSRSP